MIGHKIVVLATGGTIAGRAAHAHDHLAYTAAQLPVDELLQGLQAPAGCEIAAEQVAQVDSKDMSFDVWARLAERCMHWLAQPELRGIVITHGTDTVEETAYLLQALLAPSRPIVLTGAMRPATSLAADGPQNLQDALAVAAEGGARGVSVVFAGRIHGALEVAKVHGWRSDAFSSGEAGPLGFVEDGRVRAVRPWPAAGAASAQASLQRVLRPGDWPWVEIVTSHAGARGRLVEALVAQGVRGLVAAGTGNGTLHEALEAALLAAQAQGVKVLRSSRCAEGRVLPHAGDRLPHTALTPVKARIALMLELMA